MARIKTEITEKGVISSIIGDEPDKPGSTFKVDEDVNSGVATQTTEEMHIYVNDVTGNDSNIGTSGSPLKTYAAAVALVPAFIKHNVTIHLAPHGGDGYIIATLENKQTDYGKMIHITGDDNFTELLSSTAAASGTGQALIVGSGFTTDAYLGKTIEILTGNAAGDRRSIRNNTTTDIIPVYKFTAAVAPGDTYRIVEPTVALQLVVTSILTSPPTDEMRSFIRNCAGISDRLLSNGALEDHGPSVIVSNLALYVSGPIPTLATISIVNSSVVLFGIEARATAAFNFARMVADTHSMLQSGLDRDDNNPTALLPFETGLAATNTSWLGWGLTFLGGTYLQMLRFKGFICVEHKTEIQNAEWRILGGSFNEANTAETAALLIEDRSRIKFAGRTDTPILVRSSQDDPEGACLRVWSGSTVEFEYTTFEKTNQGFAIGAYTSNVGQGCLPPAIGLNKGITVTGVSSSSAPDLGMFVAGGGLIAMIGGSNLTMSGFPTDRDMVVLESQLATSTIIEGQAKSYLSGSGQCLPTATVADARYGLIRRV